MPGKLDMEALLNAWVASAAMSNDVHRTPGTVREQVHFVRGEELGESWREAERFAYESLVALVAKEQP